VSQTEVQPKPSRPDEIRNAGIKLSEMIQALAQSEDGLQAVAVVRAILAVQGSLVEIAAQMADINARDTAAEYRCKQLEDFVQNVQAELSRQHVIMPVQAPLKK
jgi:cell division protein ZapA (FtsZ GTPase activity inhibitor)